MYKLVNSWEITVKSMLSSVLALQHTEGLRLLGFLQYFLVPLTQIKCQTEGMGV